MRRIAANGGYTIVEMLVGILLTLVVFGAVLTALDSFSSEWSSGEQRIQAQNFARLGIDRIVRQLRNIASLVAVPKLLERATPYDIVFQTVGERSGDNLAGTERVRYCVPSDPSPGDRSQEVLIGETQTWSTSTAPDSPWSSDPTADLSCPDSPVPSGVSQTVIANSVTNRYPGRTGGDVPVFTFNNGDAPSDLGQIFTVQVNLLVNPDPSPTFKVPDAQVNSAAFLRNQPRAPVADFTWTATGGGGVLLNGGTAYSPDGEDLSFSWSCTDPSPCPNSSALSTADTGLVDWQPGAGTYTVTLTVTDQTGLQKTSDPQTVTVT